MLREDGIGFWRAPQCRLRWSVLEYFVASHAVADRGFLTDANELKCDGRSEEMHLVEYWLE